MRFKTWFEQKVMVPVAVATQKHKYDCGPAALRAVAEYFGVDLDQDDFIKFCDAGERKGTHPEDLAKVAKALGLHATIKQHMTLEELLHHVTREHPVICAIQAWGNRKNYDHLEDGHYVVAMGFDPKKKTVLFQDPSMHDGSRGEIPYDEFVRRWHDKEAYPERKVTHLGIVIWADPARERDPNYKAKSKKIP